MATDSRLLQNSSEEQGRQNQEGLELDLVEMLYRLLEKARYIILAALLGAVIMAVYTFRFVTPTYTATSKLYIVNSKDSVINLTDLQIGSSLASDYLEVFTTYTVNNAVKQKLNLPYSWQTIRSMVSVSNRASTRILHISVNSSNPKEAAAMANAFAEAAKEFIGLTMNTSEPTNFEYALEPTVPSSPNKVRNIALGFLVGALVAAVVIIIQFIADDRIRNAEMLEKRLGLPVLGMMPAASTEDSHTATHTKHRRTGGKGGHK